MKLASGESPAPSIKHQRQSEEFRNWLRGRPSRTTLALIKALFPIRERSLASSEHLFNTQVAYSVPLHCTLAPLSFASESALHWHTRHITHAMDLQNKNKLFSKARAKMLQRSKTQGPLNSAHGYPRRRWRCVRL